MEYPFIAIIPGSLWPGEVAPDKVLSMGQIELFDSQTGHKQMIHAKLNYLE